MEDLTGKYASPNDILGYFLKNEYKLKTIENSERCMTLIFYKGKLHRKVTLMNADYDFDARFCFTELYYVNDDVIFKPIENKEVDIVVGSYRSPQSIKDELIKKGWTHLKNDVKLKTSDVENYLTYDCFFSDKKVQLCVTLELKTASNAKISFTNDLMFVKAVEKKYMED